RPAGAVRAPAGRARRLVRARGAQPGRDRAQRLVRPGRRRPLAARGRRRPARGHGVEAPVRGPAPGPPAGGPSAVVTAGAEAVVVVSDGGPIAFSRTPAGLVAERRRGGLVTTLERATAGLGGRAAWVATTPDEWDGAAAAEAYARAVPGPRAALDCVRVAPDE